MVDKRVVEEINKDLAEQRLVTLNHGQICWNSDASSRCGYLLGQAIDDLHYQRVERNRLAADGPMFNTRIAQQVVNQAIHLTTGFDNVIHVVPAIFIQRRAVVLLDNLGETGDGAQGSP